MNCCSFPAVRRHADGSIVCDGCGWVHREPQDEVQLFVEAVQTASGDRDTSLRSKLQNYKAAAGGLRRSEGLKEDGTV